MLSSEQLRRSLRVGAQVIIAVQVLSQCVSLAATAVLYRQLGPLPYGLFGMVVPLLTVLRIFNSGGLDVAAIQQAEVSNAQLSSLFWINQILGLIMTVVGIAAAPLLAWFFHEPGLLWLTMALAGTSAVVALSTQHQALLQRDMRLGTAAVVRLTAQVVGAIVAIASALLGAGVWSLVALQYSEQFCLAILSWWVVAWRPQWIRRGVGAMRMLRFGGYFTLSNFLSFLACNVDKAIVGHRLGPVALGLYSQAFAVMMKPVFVLLTPLCNMMLPSLSRAAHDPVEFRQLLLGFFRTIGAATLPCTVGLVIVGREAMLVLGGGQWAGAGDLLVVLSLSIVAQTYVTSLGGVFASVGNTRRLFLGWVAVSATMCAAFFAGDFLGDLWGDAALGVAIGFSASLALVAGPAFVYYCLRTLHIPLLDLLVRLYRPALAALAMGALVMAAKWAILAGRPQTSAIVLLTVEALVGASSYVYLARTELFWLLRLRHGVQGQG